MYSLESAPFLHPRLTKSQIRTLWEIAQGYTDNPFIDSPAEKQTPKKLSRREFGIAMGVLGIGSVVSRVVDIETKGRRYKRTVPGVLAAAAEYKRRFKLGLYADYPQQYKLNEKHDPEPGIKKLKEKVGKLNSTGLFMNLEDVDETWTMRELKEKLLKINKQGSKPILSIHMYSNPFGKHPFDMNDERVMAQMEHYAQKLKEVLDDLPFEIEIRPFYEMNLPFVFPYCRGNGLSDAKQAAGYKHVIEIFFKELHQAKYPRPLAFSPSVTYSEFIRNYWVDEIDDLTVFPRVGGDYYDIFPGSLEVLLARHPDLVSEVKWLRQYFVGRLSPDDVLEPGLAILQNLATGGTKDFKHELVVFELGSVTHDIRLLQYSTLLAAAYGADEVDIFGINKSYEQNEKPFEIDWRLSPEEELMYAMAVRVLDCRVLSPHKVTASGLYIAV